MASYSDLATDWSTLCPDCCQWTKSDLQLAAELGKTLLDRNKTLEKELRQCQHIVDDQTQEIEYLTKQTAALREVNDSRLRIYEQLEISIQDLESDNQRHVSESAADKKAIKSLTSSNDTLEVRCEELQRRVDEVTLHQETFRRRQCRTTSLCSDQGVASSPAETGGDDRLDDVDERDADEDKMVGLMAQLREVMAQRSQEQRRIADLEEKLAALWKDNNSLEEQLANRSPKEANMLMQEETSMLEEVRLGHLCRKCRHLVDSRDQDELSLLMDHEEEEDVSIVNSLASETHRSTVILQIEDSGHHIHYDNPYRILVEKYEALVQMQRPTDSKRHSVTANSLSLQEELQMSGDFNSFNAKDIEESEHETDVVVPAKQHTHSKITRQTREPAGKTFSMTPTDFSEAETSSSGFSDETSNKMTQTDNNPPPGSFLCSIADGTDCKFSIYDDANPVESRFRKKPQYRQLFREIFDVLKRAAENKDEGEQLPLLDDFVPAMEAPKVPPATPAREDLPENFPPKIEPLITEEDSKSIADELAAITNSLPECSKLPGKAIEEAAGKSVIEPKVVQLPTEPPKKSPPKQDILEYLSIGVGIKKKSKKNSPAKQQRLSAERVERMESPTVTRSGNSTSRRRRESRLAERLNDSASNSRAGSPGVNAWYNRDAAQASSSQGANSHTEKPYVSAPSTTVSQNIAELKRLEKSYAEVLRSCGPQTSHWIKPTSINGFRRQ